ncbi:MAG: DUF4124 domain-containing protein [Proteobacteria bacterium]|nr:DUF4124 domain-containing protein [Pseudomonadota bacterium]MBS0609295.1 DUF4124 domain-containing protein [Pseudomonadota bacterium]
MKPYKLLLLALACTWATGAFAQWQWLDKDGRKVFSDRPPPQDVPEKNILKQPHLSGSSRAAAAAASTGATSDAAAPARAAVGTGKDKQLEENKAKADAAEAAKKQAEQERQAKVRADNCARARQAKVQLAPGRLVGYTSANGERGYMDDATRAAELNRTDAVIASDCQ